MSASTYHSIFLSVAGTKLSKLAQKLSPAEVTEKNFLSAIEVSMFPVPVPSANVVVVGVILVVVVIIIAAGNSALQARTKVATFFIATLKLIEF